MRPRCPPAYLYTLRQLSNGSKAIRSTSSYENTSLPTELNWLVGVKQVIHIRTY